MILFLDFLFTQVCLLGQRDRKERNTHFFSAKKFNSSLGFHFFFFFFSLSLSFRIISRGSKQLFFSKQDADYQQEIDHGPKSTAIFKSNEQTLRFLKNIWKNRVFFPLFSCILKHVKLLKVKRCKSSHFFLVRNISIGA